MIRAALGTASVLGLAKVKMDIAPRTAHLMTPGRCRFDCKFCSQAKTSKANQKLLSRIAWPEFEKKKLLEALNENQGSFKRVCLQVVHSNGYEEVLAYIKDIKSACSLPLSIDMKAEDMDIIRRTFEAGADVVGLPIDCADPSIYSSVKNGAFYSQLDLIRQASREFTGRISTHLIIGLGESERDAVKLMQKMHGFGVTLGLFAFTPIKGTSLEGVKKPAIEHYRRIQVARFLIYNDISHTFKFDKNGKITGFGLEFEELGNAIKLSAFMTTGCMDCNRPFYNENPGGELYNYPYELSSEDYQRALIQATKDTEAFHG